MNGFAAWGLTILGLAVVTTVAEMLLPQGKTRKVIRSVFATVAVLVIVTPIPGLLKNTGGGLGAEDGPSTDEGYLGYVESIKSDAAEKAVKEQLRKSGYSDDFRLTVEFDGFAVKSVSVDFSESGITGEGAHINKSEIIGLIASYFGVGEEAIMTYG